MTTRLADSKSESPGEWKLLGESDATDPQSEEELETTANTVLGKSFGSLNTILIPQSKEDPLS